EELALYTLIWNRFVASQMSSAVYDATAVDVQAGSCRFRATGQILKFDGFIRVYTEGRDDDQVADEETEGLLPPLAEGDRLRLLELVPEQHFTQPPPRFTQATLIKELEEQGIGRPSTYASIMGTMIIKWGRRGEFLACRGYPDCKNTMNFTRDDEGCIRPVEPERTDRVCEKCGRPMQVRFGRFGKFLGCSGYPECRHMEPFHKPVPTGVTCLGCGEGEMLERRSRRGKTFYSCARYPACQFVAWDKPIAEPCPKCQAGFITEKITKRYGTVRRCVKEGCGWQEQLDTGNGEVAPLPAPRAAAKVGGRRRPAAGKGGRTKAAENGPT